MLAAIEGTSKRRREYLEENSSSLLFEAEEFA